MEIYTNKSTYRSLLKRVNRPGIDELLEWLDTTDFYEAPASTKYHLAIRGGLCRHSLDVYSEMQRLIKAYPEVSLPEESVIIVSLLHDLCKANFYTVEMRNTKVDGQWVQVPYYSVSEKLVYGSHGPKSTYLIMSHMALTADEAIAVSNHMGGFAESPQGAANAYKECPLGWLLHVADESATYIVEK